MFFDNQEDKFEKAKTGRVDDITDVVSARNVPL